MIVIVLMIFAFLSMFQYMAEKDDRYAIMFVVSAVLATILKIKGF